MGTELVIMFWRVSDCEELVVGASKNWILIYFIEKPVFNQFMSVFAMKF